MKKKEFKKVIFDLDQTLVNTLPLMPYVEAIKKNPMVHQAIRWRGVSMTNISLIVGSMMAWKRCLSTFGRKTSMSVLSAIR